jgi:hypothetical protein
MWHLTNHTPYAVGKSWGRNKDGVHEWLVAVKATFDIAPDGRTTLADEQPPPVMVPEHHGEPGVSSLRYDMEIVAPKPTTDIVVNGTAHAPKGRPSTEFAVSMRVGSIQKTLRVLGKRRWGVGVTGITSSAPEPMIELPITYERAYGGWDRTDQDPRNQRMDLRNPVGCGVVAKPEYRVGRELPCFEYPQGDVATAGPAGFGALDVYWSPRREQAGTYDAKWEETRRPLLPVDWDPRSLQCAPVDQRPPSHLRGGELVELVHLTPSGVLRFTLPKIYLTYRTMLDGKAHEHRGTLSSVILEPDVPRVMMVWTTSLLCRTNGEYLDETVIQEKAYL